MTLEYIFVYGTLRKESATDMHNVLARHCEYLADGYMQGRLYEVAGYPGAIESDDINDKVYGEVYRIISAEDVLSLLDEYEGCTDKFPEPREYIRKALSIRLVSGDKVAAWVYIFNHSVANRVQIESGDYAKHLSTHGSQ